MGRRRVVVSPDKEVTPGTGLEAAYPISNIVEQIPAARVNKGNC